MKKALLLVFASILIFSGCGNKEVETKKRKDTISENEIMEYFERLLEPFVELSNVKTDKQALEALKVLDDISIEISRELKREYEKDIHAVNDLIALADTFRDIVNAAEEEPLFINDYYDEVGNHIFKISIEYLDGDLPDNYAKVIGVKNLYDLRE